MRNARFSMVILAALCGAAVAASAQAAPVPDAGTRRGFSSQALVAQLSLYLPEDATRGMRGGSGGRQLPQLQFTRDPKLFLTKDQITKLIPILQSLRENPLPTPSKAKQVQADVDGVLTAAQKAEWADFEKKIQQMIADFRQRTAASGAGGPGAGDAGPGSGPGAGGMTTIERRQRQLDAFIAILQDRLKTPGQA